MIRSTYLANKQSSRVCYIKAAFISSRVCCLSEQTQKLRNVSKELYRSRASKDRAIKRFPYKQILAIAFAGVGKEDYYLIKSRFTKGKLRIPTRWNGVRHFEHQLATSLQARSVYLSNVNIGTKVRIFGSQNPDYQIVSNLSFIAQPFSWGKIALLKFRKLFLIWIRRSLKVSRQPTNYEGSEIRLDFVWLSCYVCFLRQFNTTFLSYNFNFIDNNNATIANNRRKERLSESNFKINI